MTQQNTTQETGNTKEEKVFQLCQELEDMQKKKKASSKAYNSEIKRLTAEIKDLVDPPNEEDEDI
jgi:hypothetical protein